MNSYLFDEPSSFLDVKQRLKAAKVIRDLCKFNKYVVVIEHDLVRVLLSWLLFDVVRYRVCLY